jgi:hypothetical protein
VKHARYISKPKAVKAQVGQGAFLTVLEFLLLRLTANLADKKAEKQTDSL